jgi:hypothetical protein
MNGISFISRKGSRLRRGNNFIPTPPPRFYFCFLFDPKVKITGFNPMAIVPAGECIPISSEPNRLILRQGLDMRLSSLFCLARFSESRATCVLMLVSTPFSVWPSSSCAQCYYPDPRPHASLRSGGSCTTLAPTPCVLAPKSFTKK